MKQKILILLVALACCLPTFAYDFMVNGLAYSKNSDGTSVQVTSSSQNSGGNAYSGSVVIPSSVTYEGIEYPVTCIGDCAFLNCSNLTSVTIPSSITEIQENAFYECTGLTKVSISDLGAWCSIDFMGETSNPIWYAHCLYLNGVKVTDLIIPESVTSIGANAFCGYSQMTSVTIPESVASIGRYAFFSCPGLTSVTIPESVTSIGSSAFYSCSGLTSVAIPNSVTSIGSSAFKYCSGLTSVTIPNSVTSIGNDTFNHCSGLTSVAIPESITSIGSSAFSDCTGLTSVTIPESVTSIGSSAFYSCSGLTSVAIPNSVTSIGSSTFDLCTGLTSVTIPESVTSIGNYAFFSCTGLTTISIPSSVTSIGSCAFRSCSSLTSITALNSDPSTIVMGNDVFEYVKTTSCTLYVPEESVYMYFGAAQWSDFENILPILAAQSVSLDKTEMTIAVGESATLTATVLPEGATDKTVTWRSSDPTAATVNSNGEVTAVAVGTATITAACGEASATCTVTVRLEKCATPEIALNADGDLVITCDTEGAAIEAKVECEDQHDYSDLASGVRIPLTGQYIITASATAENKADSETATAMLVWTKGTDDQTGISVIKTKTERAVLVYTEGESIALRGTADGETVMLHTIDGTAIYSGTATEGTFVIPATLTKGTIYVVTIGGRAVKYKL